MSWWWPFSKKQKEEAAEVESQFHAGLREALLNQADLQKATEQLRAERHRRLAAMGADVRPKLNSQPG